MNKITLSLAALLLSNLVFSQAMAQSVAITKDIKGFNEVSLNTAGELILKQGPKDSIKIVAPQEILADLNVYKSGETLKLGLKESDYRAKSVKYYVTLQNIAGINDSNSGVTDVLTDIRSKDLALSVSNSGSLSVKNITADSKTSVSLANSGTISIRDLKAKTVSLKLSDSGKMNIDKLSASALTSSISNSGTISIAGGSINKQKISLYNSGYFKAADLKSKTADVTLKNSGSIYANISDEISLDLSGSGDLYLYGKPRMNSILISGSSKIHSES